jgi:hypothetical protein
LLKNDNFCGIKWHRKERRRVSITPSGARYHNALSLRSVGQ